MGRIVGGYIIYLDLDPHHDICVYPMCRVGKLDDRILFPLCGQYVYALIVW